MPAWEWTMRKRPKFEAGRGRRGGKHRAANRGPGWICYAARAPAPEIGIGSDLCPRMGRERQRMERSLKAGSSIAVNWRMKDECEARNARTASSMPLSP
jgi:hypothetical protein